MKPRVLYEDNHLLVVDKPAGMVTAGVVGRPSVYGWAGEYIRHRYNKPGNVFVGIVSRLDSLTSGVLVLARTSKAAARLSDQIRRGTVRKTYLAILEGEIAAEPGRMEDRLYKDDQAHRMRVDASADHPDAQSAVLEYRRLWRGESLGARVSLAEVNLVTGRKHQIRVQFAARRHPIIGDRKYGSLRPLVGRGIGLHSSGLTFKHPTRDEQLEFSAPPPESWPSVIRGLG